MKRFVLQRKMGWNQTKGKCWYYKNPKWNQSKKVTHTYTRTRYRESESIFDSHWYSITHSCTHWRNWHKGGKNQKMKGFFINVCRTKEISKIRGSLWWGTQEKVSSFSKARWNLFFLLLFSCEWIFFCCIFLSFFRIGSSRNCRKTLHYWGG